MSSSCNKELAVNSDSIGQHQPDSSRPANGGYLRNNGYPQYYRGSGDGNDDCRWTIRVSTGRKVRLTILDMSISRKLI